MSSIIFLILILPVLYLMIVDIAAGRKMRADRQRLKAATEQS